jgi:hypothetical protein
LDPTVTWLTPDGGTVSSVGGVSFFPPLAAGDYAVRAVSNANEAVTAQVIVRRLLGVAVDPPEATLDAGGSLGFVVFTNAASPVVTWTVDHAGGGTVTQSGVYTAPMAGGTFTVRATVSAAGQTASGTATAIVAPPPPTIATRTRLNVLSVVPPPPNTTGPSTVTFQAAVKAATGSATPSGNVAFSVDHGAAVSAPLVNGVATWTVALTGFTVADASYTGDATHIPSNAISFVNTTHYLPDSVNAACSDGTQFITCPTTPGAPGYGQDGSFTVNLPSFFVSDLGEWAEDTVTHLVWMPTDSSGTVRNFDESQAYCAANAAAAYGGISDWRLPTAREALTIVNTGRNLGAVGPVSFFPELQNAGIWTTDAYAGSPGMNWTLALNYPIWEAYARGGNLPPPNNQTWPGTTCVSSSAAPNAATPTTGGAFLIQPNGRTDVRLDVHTRMYWQAATGAIGGQTTFTWLEALDYCNSLNAQGLGGITSTWRLPSLKELWTIVDVSGASPAVDSSVFPDTVPGLYWSSSPFANSPDEAYPVNFATGLGSILLSETTMTARHAVRCVAAGSITNVMLMVAP